MCTRNCDIFASWVVVLERQTNREINRQTWISLLGNDINFKIFPEMILMIHLYNLYREMVMKSLLFLLRRIKDYYEIIDILQHLVNKILPAVYNVRNRLCVSGHSFS